MFFFSDHNTMPKYWTAWKKFMMKNASPKVLKPQVRIEHSPVVDRRATLGNETT